MAFVEYILLALLGSTAASAPVGTPGSPAIRTLDAGAITQPSGGAADGGDVNAGIGLLGQGTTGTPGKQADTGRKGRHKLEARRHRVPRRHHKATKSGKGNTQK